MCKKSFYAFAFRFLYMIKQKEHFERNVPSVRTLQEIADYLGIYRSTYTYYEIGKTGPSLNIL